MISRRAAIVMAILSAILFGAATPASKLLLGELTPFRLAGLLYLGAALSVSPAVVSLRRFSFPRVGDGKTFLRLCGAVVFGGLLGPIALLFGLKAAEAASVSLWLNLELAATAVIGVIFFKDHLGRAGWLGVAAAIVASVILSWSSDVAGAMAGLLVAAACCCWGIDNHLTALIDGISPTESTFWKGLIAGTVNLTIGNYLADGSMSFSAIAGALAVGAVAYGASIVLYIQSAQAMGATRAQVVFASAPFFGVALSVLWLGEPLVTAHLIAVPLFVAGIGLLMLEEHNHEHTHETITHEHFHRHDDGHHDHVHDQPVPSVGHSHSHSHDSVTHSHPHWPDLHHRHQHNSEQADA